MKTKKILIIPLIILAMSILACGQLSVGIEPEVTEDVQIPPLEETLDTNAGTQVNPENARDETSEPDYSDLWVEVEDYRTGLRFAIPCFWVANVPSPEYDPTGLGSFSVNNFTEEFVTGLGPKRSQTVFEIGGLKFDIGYHQRSFYGFGPDVPLEQLAYAIANPDAENGIRSTTLVSIGSVEALEVVTFGTFGEGLFYLIPFGEDLVILFGPSQADHPDIQAILHSIALSPDQEVVKPTHKPADPPVGMAAPCMGIEASSQADAEPLTGTLDCNTVTDSDPLMWVICNVRDSIASRNTQPLMSFMADPFVIGYWQSEGATRSREEAFNEIVQSHLSDTPGGEVFTMDTSQFPPLFGQPPEDMFGPEDKPAAILYSEGWGKDGQGAALLYFKEGSEGRYYLYALVIAQGHFDK